MRCVKLIDAPVGLFLFGRTLALKTEYSTVHNDGVDVVTTPDCYIVESGEYFWGGAKTVKQRNGLPVIPLCVSENCEVE